MADKPIDLEKQIRYATALALTRTVKDAQREVIDSIQENFDVRTAWYLPSNAIGIKVTPATKNNLSASIHTEAGKFLGRHETGEDKTPQGEFIAVPTTNVRRTKRDLIARSARPRALRGAFIMQTRRGPGLFQRAGKKGLRMMYSLRRVVHIKRRPTVIAPVERVVKERFAKNFEKSLEEAIRTAK